MIVVLPLYDSLKKALVIQVDRKGVDSSEGSKERMGGGRMDAGRWIKKIVSKIIFEEIKGW